MRRVARGSSLTRPASFNSRKCRDTAGRLIGRSSAISPTVRPPEPSSSTMARRLESPRASNGSPLKGATDIGRKRNKNATVDRKPVGSAARVEEGKRERVRSELVWSGGMPLGLFKGVRTYTLAPEGNGTTKFRMREEYTGPLLPVIWRSIPDLGLSFTQVANGLKQRAEAGR